MTPEAKEKPSVTYKVKYKIATVVNINKSQNVAPNSTLLAPSTKSLVFCLMEPKSLADDQPLGVLFGFVNVSTFPFETKLVFWEYPVKLIMIENKSKVFFIVFSFFNNGFINVSSFSI